MNDLMSGWKNIFRDLSESGGLLLATGVEMKELNCDRQVLLWKQINGSNL
jgi:hypothetical protein